MPKYLPDGKHPIPKQPNFSRILEAREALQRKAEKWANDYANLIEQAVKKGDIEFGTKAIQWAFEHMIGDEGERVVGGSVDKVKEVQALQAGPSIQIGFALGGLPSQPRALEGDIVEHQGGNTIRALLPVETVSYRSEAAGGDSQVQSEEVEGDSGERRGDHERHQASLPADQRVASVGSEAHNPEVSSGHVPQSGEGVIQEVGTRCQSSTPLTEESVTTQMELPSRSLGMGRSRGRRRRLPTQPPLTFAGARATK